MTLPSETDLSGGMLDRREKLPWWQIASVVLIVAACLLPALALIWIAVSADDNVWPHLVSFVLPRTIFDTVGLLVLVALGTGIIGAGTAWLTTLCRFPGRRFFAWALVLPLAVPTYISAYTQVEFFDFAGPVQTSLRSAFGFQSGRDYWFPDIRSLWGAGLIFSLVLYPYVYLTCRLLFSTQGAAALDASRSLGASAPRVFLRIGLPMARPALAAGIALALMETLNDIGAVEQLGVKTITFAVFETWLNRESLAGAVQLALLSLVLILFLLALERWARNNRSYMATARDKPPAQLELSPTKQVLAFCACALPILLGLGVPLFVLGTYALRRLPQFQDPALLTAAGNSVLVAALAAGLGTTISYGLLQIKRLSGSRRVSLVTRFSMMGYAVPGTVLAIGLLIPIAAFDNWLDSHMRALFGASTGLLFSGTIAVLIYACTLRYLAVAHGAVETGMARLSPRIDMAARSLGRTAPQVARQIHIPVLLPALATAFLLIFVDVMKELSATLLLRPFDFETLATFVYDRASQAAVEDASLGALIILLIGLVPVVLLTRLSPESRAKAPR